VINVVMNFPNSKVHLAKEERSIVLLLNLSAVMILMTKTIQVSVEI
jgi:hypothetical protein